MKLSERQQNILHAVVGEHIKKAAPVGSKELVEQANLKVSPATIRHEMNVLEQEGLLEQPHTSAGRVPTDRGYRIYVKSLMNGKLAQQQRQQELERRLNRIRHHYAALAQDLCYMLADFTQQGVITQSGQEGDKTERSGMSNLINLPELKNSEIAQAVAEVFDKPEVLLSHINKNTEQKKYVELEVPNGSPVQVYIGSDTGLGKVPLSVLVSSFTNEEGGQGHLILVGPSRMPYRRNVQLLSYVSKLLSRDKLGVIIAIALPSALIISNLSQ